MKKIARQEMASTSQPPTSGPTAVDTPESPAQAPMAAPWSSSAMQVRSAARLPGTRMAPPVPWSARARDSPVTLDTAPHSAEARANHTTPTRKMRRWP